MKVHMNDNTTLNIGGITKIEFSPNNILLRAIDTPQYRGVVYTLPRQDTVALELDEELPQGDFWRHPLFPLMVLMNEWVYEYGNWWDQLTFAQMMQAFENDGYGWLPSLLAYKDACYQY